jgi:hypothetical protein
MFDVRTSSTADIHQADGNVSFVPPTGDLARLARA